MLETENNIEVKNLSKDLFEQNCFSRTIFFVYIYILLFKRKILLVKLP